MSKSDPSDTIRRMPKHMARRALAARAAMYCLDDPLNGAADLVLLSQWIASGELSRVVQTATVRSVYSRKRAAELDAEEAAEAEDASTGTRRVNPVELARIVFEARQKGQEFQATQDKVAATLRRTTGGRYAATADFAARLRGVGSATAGAYTPASGFLGEAFKAAQDKEATANRDRAAGTPPAQGGWQDEPWRHAHDEEGADPPAEEEAAEPPPAKPMLRMFVLNEKPSPTALTLGAGDLLTVDLDPGDTRVRIAFHAPGCTIPEHLDGERCYPGADPDERGYSAHPIENPICRCGHARNRHRCIGEPFTSVPCEMCGTCTGWDERPSDRCHRSDCGHPSHWHVLSNTGPGEPRWPCPCGCPGFVTFEAATEAQEEHDNETAMARLVRDGATFTVPSTTVLDTGSAKVPAGPRPGTTDWMPVRPGGPVAEIVDAEVQCTACPHSAKWHTYRITGHGWQLGQCDGETASTPCPCKHFTTVPMPAVGEPKCGSCGDEAEVHRTWEGGPAWLCSLLRVQPAGRADEWRCPCTGYEPAPASPTQADLNAVESEDEPVFPPTTTWHSEPAGVEIPAGDEEALKQACVNCKHLAGFHVTTLTNEGQLVTRQCTRTGCGCTAYQEVPAHV